MGNIASIGFCCGEDRSSNKAMKVSYVAGGRDVAKFDRAYRNNDFKSMIKLMSSTEKVQGFEADLHPWAANPVTIGALVGSQIALRAAVCVKEDASDFKELLRREGAVPHFVEFLRSGEVDRVDVGTIALHFLSTEHAGIAQDAYRAGAMALLLRHAGSECAGKRLSVGCALRNMFISSKEARQEFISSDGTEALVQLLTVDASETPSKKEGEANEHRWEAVLNLQDLLEPEEGQVDAATTRRAAAAGALKRVQAFHSSPDEELAAQVKKLVATLETHG